MNYEHITPSQKYKFRALVNRLGFETDFKESRLTLNDITGVAYLKIETHPHPIYNISITGYITRRGKLIILEYISLYPERDAIQKAELLTQLSRKSKHENTIRTR